MTQDEEAKELNDPFAVLLLRRGIFPTTVHDVLDAITAATSDGDPLRSQTSFVLGEGSQIPFSDKTADLDRGLRLAVTCGRDSEIDVLVSSAASGDFDQRFLQV